jgi:hypothetical protein
MAKLTEYDKQRAQRNLHPHAEARLAMALWSHEYAHEQTGGSMDFWDSRTPYQQQLCRDIVSAILEAAEKNGRAALQERT